MNPMTRAVHLGVRGRSAARLVAELRRRIRDQRRIAGEAAECARQAEAAGRSGRVFAERSCVAQAEREIFRLEAELAELTRDHGYAPAQAPAQEDSLRSVH
jgi:hypothetical protein